MPRHLWRADHDVDPDGGDGSDNLTSAPELGGFSIFVYPSRIVSHYSKRPSLMELDKCKFLQRHKTLLMLRSEVNLTVGSLECARLVPTKTTPLSNIMGDTDTDLKSKTETDLC